MTYDARPRTMGSWTFLLREGGQNGLLAAEVNVRGLFNEGMIRVGEIPFELDREGLSRTYRLLFEGRAFVRAEAQGPISNAYDLTVEAALLESGVPVGARAAFVWKPTSFTGSTYELFAGRERVGRVEKTAALFRHYALQFEAEVPLVLQAFCFSLLLARLRRQSHG